MTRILLSIGSNIEPETNFKRCANALATHFEHPLWSPVYRSAAVGMDSDDFLNAVVSAQTVQTIESVAQLLKKIESELGRVRTSNKFSSRTMDVDLLLFGDSIINTPTITIPRAEITTAAHVLIPIVDLIPNDTHPVLKKTYSALLSELKRAKPEVHQTLSKVALNF